MIRHASVVLPLLTAIGLFLGSHPAGGQTAGPAPVAWQPFRSDLTELPPTDLTGGSVAPPVLVAQAPCEGIVMCPQPMFAAPAYDLSGYYDPRMADPSNPSMWHWRVLPDGVIYSSYWAGVHEPRISGVIFQNDGTNFIDATLGGRASLVRFGTDGPGRPQGAELQVEGAAFPRLNLDEDWDLEAVDFRFGLPLVYGRDKWQTKFSYYHLSSHLGDERIVRNMSFAERINFSRDALVLGLSYYPLPAWRWYAEAGWSFYDDVAEQWEFQFGVDIAEPGPTGFYGTPFVAINGHIREELDYGGNVTAQAGWLWRGDGTRTLRLGAHYYNGKSNQFELFNEFEEQIGASLWYDF